MTGPTHPAAGGGRLRAGHADREQAIETLKDAFVAGQLTTDELAARTGLALTARTRAELAALTADIPAAAATAAPARKRGRPAARARRRRPLAKAAAGSGACIASAFGLILFAANYLDPRGLGNPYHPWSGLCAMVAMFLVIAAMLIVAAGVSAHAEQRRSRRRLPRGPAPGVSDLDGGERADRGPVPPAHRDGRAPRAELRARQSRQRRRHVFAREGRAPGGGTPAPGAA